MNRVLSFLIICFSFSAVMFSCGSSGTEGEASTIAETPAATSEAESVPKTIKSFINLDAVGFQNMMNDPNVVVMDVRRPGEIEYGKIEGALEMDVLGADFKERMQKLDKDKTYLIYCASGKRSVTACRAMSESGFEHLYNLDGGYEAWQRSQKAQQ